VNICSMELDLAARLLYRDALMLVLDKPAGLPVHAGPKGGPNLAAMLGALSFGLPRPPELAHRLDKDTSGCLVLGRHAKALARLGTLFATGRVDKTYWAIVEGGPSQEAGRIDMALARRSPERGWWMRPDPAGQAAATRFRVLGRAAGLCWLELMPETGRTHQLRVHCAASGYPILGDAVYGTAQRFSGDPLMLHARAVSVPIYPKKNPVAVEAEAPTAMKACLARLAPPC
jgi:tRNA pseudouridine32 synthase/23S rRNA pseudouridine746 synthase